MKNVQISFDETLLELVDKYAAASRTPRSVVVRQALKLWLHKKEIDRFEHEWIKKLKEHPDDQTTAEEWMGAEAWGDK